MNYLLIHEDGSFCLIKEVTKAEEESADEGLCDIVDMKNKTQYHNGEWVEIEEYEGYPS